MPTPTLTVVVGASRLAFCVTLGRRGPARKYCGKQGPLLILLDGKSSLLYGRACVDEHGLLHADTL